MLLYLSQDVSGTIDIKDSLGGDKLASLIIRTDASTNASFVLSATNLSATPMYLRVNQDAPSIPGNPGAKTVSLRVPIFQRNDASTMDYCAQFDPRPINPSPLTAEPCITSPTSHASQEFAYTPLTGAIQPLWSHAVSTPDSNTTKRSVDCEGSPSTQFNAMNSTTALGNSTGVSPVARNVTLYFTPIAVAGEVYALNGPSVGDGSTTMDNDDSVQQSNNHTMATNSTNTLTASIPSGSSPIVDNNSKDGNSEGPDEDDAPGTEQGSYAQLSQSPNPLSTITPSQPPTPITFPLPAITVTQVPSSAISSPPAKPSAPSVA